MTTISPVSTTFLPVQAAPSNEPDQLNSQDFRALCNAFDRDDLRAFERILKQGSFSECEISDLLSESLDCIESVGAATRMEREAVLLLAKKLPLKQDVTRAISWAVLMEEDVALASELFYLGQVDLDKETAQDFWSFFKEGFSKENLELF